MSATDKLRALLDEMGVEWEDGGMPYMTEWATADGRDCSAMYWKPTLTVLISGCTPEQAVVATLGAIDKGAPQGADGNLDQAQVDWLRLMPDGWDGTAPDTLGRGECEECARIAKKMLEIANEMRHIGASSMTPHQLFCCWAHDIERAVKR